MMINTILDNLKVTFKEFDYDKMIETTWERDGFCNHCGECCKTMIYIDDSDTHIFSKDGEENTNCSGVWHEWEAYGRKRYWKIRIESDEKKGDCHKKCGAVCQDGAPIKSLLCTAWPLHPDHVTAFPECSYTFTELDSVKIEYAEKMVEGIVEKIEEIVCDEKALEVS